MGCAVGQGVWSGEMARSMQEIGLQTSLVVWGLRFIRTDHSMQDSLRMTCGMGMGVTHSLPELSIRCVHDTMKGNMRTTYDMGKG